jgi:nitrite reductase (NADH) small subunit/3-phenylpropionate/trans-cinnamate dioxygenase ferredoxin subunit
MEREPSERSELEWHAIASKSDLPVDGGGKSFDAAGRRVALFLDEGEVRALDDTCPHMGASLGMGVALAGDVTCPWHGWHFRLRDGCNTDGLEARVAAHPVRVRADGTVEVGLPPRAH